MAEAGVSQQTSAGISAEESVGVFDEFGRLQEVILGSPLSEEDRIFDWTEGMDEELSWLTGETLKWLKAGSGKTWKDADRELMSKINRQVMTYAQTLVSRGVTVHLLPKLTGEDRNYVNGGVEQLWPRDVWCTAGDTVIVSALRMPWKRKQQFAGLPLYTRRMAAGGCRFLSAPQASTEVLSPPERLAAAERTSILLDGGDFLVNGDEIYLGIGHGSNMLGAKFVQNILGDAFKVYPLKLHPHALHLDCALALVRPGLGIICREWLCDELPPGLRDYEWIEATEKEAAWLGVNGIALDPETYIVDVMQERIIAQLTKRGVDVIAIPYDGPAFLGGALRCSSQPIRRDRP